MSLSDALLSRGLLPDPVIRFGIRRLLAERLREVRAPDAATRENNLRAFAAELDTMPVAVRTDAANEQHYEVPAAFYKAVLGPRLKYSCGLYTSPSSTLAEAEEAMLDLCCSRAELADGQEILELGCGWGSLTLHMARRYPSARITGVSNSNSQREHIEAECRLLGLTNVRILTRDMNDFAAETSRYDRVVSVEMFEHMKNYRELLRRIAGWLKPGGKLFVHIFTHRDCAYHFVARDESDWMSKYFFTGGTMPANDLLAFWQDDLRLETRWEVDGTHYQRTAEDWLRNMDAARAELREIFQRTYGDQSRRMWHYWRVFFMSCAELWGYADGREWMVCHYRFVKPAA